MAERKTLKGIERYRVNKWVEEHAEVAANNTDAECAARILGELGIDCTPAMIQYARAAFGIVKREPEPEMTLETLALEVKRLREKVARIADALGFVAGGVE